MLEHVSDESVDVKIVPDLYRLIRLRGSVEEFEGMPVIGLAGSPLEGWDKVAKRLFDIVGAAFALALLAALLGLLGWRQGRARAA